MSNARKFYSSGQVTWSAASINLFPCFNTRVSFLVFCCSVGITVLILSPHTTYSTKSLDVGVMKPFKEYYNTAMDSWMFQNPGVPVTIHELEFFIGDAYQKAMTPTNISNAFRKTGIHLFDRNIFPDIDFLPIVVTDRSKPDERVLYIIDDKENVIENDTAFSEASLSNGNTYTETNLSNNRLSSLSHDEVLRESRRNSTLNDAAIPSTLALPVAETRAFVSPKEFRPNLRAPARKNNSKYCKRGRSLIATDTPEKDQWTMERAAKQRKVPAKTKTVLLESSS